MAKFQKVGSGFVKYGNSLMNLRAYKEITNVGIPYEEDQAGGLRFTPFQPSKEDYENNVQGCVYVTYSANEAEELEEDFALIQEVLSDQN